MENDFSAGYITVLYGKTQYRSGAKRIVYYILREAEYHQVIIFFFGRLYRDDKEGEWADDATRSVLSPSVQHNIRGPNAPLFFWRNEPHSFVRDECRIYILESGDHRPHHRHHLKPTS